MRMSSLMLTICIHLTRSKVSITNPLGEMLKNAKGLCRKKIELKVMSILLIFRHPAALIIDNNSREAEKRMSRPIYALGANKKATDLMEVPFESEAQLQEIIALNPQILYRESE